MDRAARFARLRAIAAFLIGFTIPVSTSISEIVTVIAFALLVIEGEWRRNWRQIVGIPVVRASLALFLLLGLAMFYSAAPLSEAAHFWFKYRELLYLPLFLLLCRDGAAAQYGLWGVYGVVASMVALGSIQWLFHITLAPSPFGPGSVYGSYIIEGVMTALAAHYLALEAIMDPPRRIFLAVAAALALFFVLCISPGRTGIVTAFALALLLLFQTASRKHLLPGLLLIALVGGSAFMLSPEFHERVSGTVTGLQGSQENGAAISTGARMEFLRGSLAMIERRPIFGSGTGSFALEYKDEAQRQRLGLTSNPHNQYLLIGVETGLVGVAALLALLGTLWLSAARLPPADAMRGRAVTLALVISCLFNSSLLDHVDGQALFFQIGLFYFGVRGREDQRHRHDV